MSRPRRPAPGLPSEERILEFISESPTPVGKREISRAFALSGQDKVALKARLRDMENDGLIEAGPGRTFHKGGGLPKVTVLRVVDVADGQTVAVPDVWNKAGAPPRVRIVPGKRQAALGPGERVLARIEEAGQGYRAHIMKKLAGGREAVLGVLSRDVSGGLRLVPVDKRNRLDFALTDLGNAQPGDLVLAETGGKAHSPTAKIVEVLGDPFAPRSFSLIAIHEKGIPSVFPDEVLDEAKTTAARDLGPREDLRDLPIITIDPADARDHDDAVWAAPDDDAGNPGGWRAIVAIADVSFYVRPGSDLDREARKRGNSVYFPDRVVPMLPELLSADVCSLVAHVDRAVIACHLQIAADGSLKGQRFTRAVIRCAANLAYEDAQAAIDGKRDEPLLEPVLRPLWGAWGALAKARDRRAPLDLDLPERRVILDEAGRIVEIRQRERLDAHRLIEDYMIAGNVAAARAIEAKKLSPMYRVHEPPSREKLVALKDYLDTFGIALALGQVITPRLFNRMLEGVREEAHGPQVQEQVLRTQTQAYYAPENRGHFGLALTSYAHFTSPIRRYADLVVHRALVRGYGLGDGGLTDAELAGLARTGEHISQTERRAMEAERDTIDRYVAAYLSEKVGEVLPARITGVARFGFFATVDGIGGDGLVPVSHLGAERFTFDEGAQALEGVETGTRYTPGMKLDLRLAEADSITGTLRFELAEMAELPQRTRRDRMLRRGAGGNLPPGRGRSGGGQARANRRK